MLTSWFSLGHSIERIFREALPNLPVYRQRLPLEIAEQRALLNEIAGDLGKACFLHIEPDFVHDWQTVFATVWLCERNDPQSKYLPETNLKGDWLREQALRLQHTFDHGSDLASHFWPIYDYHSLIPANIYDQFMATGNTTLIADFLQSASPRVIKNTGFVVRGGHVSPKLHMDQNPMLLEWALRFEFCNTEAYQGMRGR
jgi:hypothetical protein